MDLLVDADTDASVQEAVFFAVADLLNLEVDLLFFDTTSTYFERDTEDLDPDGDAEDGSRRFRRYGHSKDHRRICPRSSSGWRSPGKASRCAAGAGRATPTTRRSSPRSRTACAAGASDGSSPWWIAGSPLGRTWPTCSARVGTTSLASGCATGTPTPTRRSRARAATSNVRDNLRVKEVQIASTPGIRWIICHNPEEAERDHAAREAAIARISAELDRITTARTRAREQARARRTASAAMSAPSGGNGAPVPEQMKRSFRR